MERYPERRRGHHPDPKQILQGRRQVNTADVPMCLTGAARRQGQDPQTLLGLRLCPPGQERLGQSDSQGVSGHQGLCTATRRSVLPLSRGPQMAELRGTSSPPRIPVPVCLGHRGPVGRSAWPWKGCQDTRPWCCAQDCKLSLIHI